MAQDTSPVTSPTPANQEPLRSSRKIIRSFKAKANANRSFSDKLADSMTSAVGSFPFLMVNVAVFVVWLTLNTGLLPGVEAFDPFPFGLLTTIVSLEAIILAIFVLISQNRSARIEDLREEIDLQVDITTEQEVTKTLELLVLLLKKNGFEVSGDNLLKEMLLPISTQKLEKTLEQQIEKS